MFWAILGISVFFIGCAFVIKNTLATKDFVFTALGVIFFLIVGICVFMLSSAAIPEFLPENVRFVEEIEIIPSANNAFLDIGNSNIYLYQNPHKLVYQFNDEDENIENSTVKEFLPETPITYIITSSEYENPVIRKYKFNSTFWYLNIHGPEICCLILPSSEQVYEVTN